MAWEGQRRIMQTVRRWSVRHASGLNRLYRAWASIAPRIGRGIMLVSRLGLDRARIEQAILPVERAAKGLFFDCQMCGQCVLSQTGMACPTNCGKFMRNGPCGGVRPDGTCEVKPGMTCVWVEATAGGKRLGSAALSATLPPVDHRRRGRSTWYPLLSGETIAPAPLPASPAQAEGPARERPVHSFEQAVRSGRFLITVEVAPPDSADPAPLIARASKFRGLVDAINITDGAGGNCHMSSAAAAAVLAANGMTPVCQIACRDRNRIAVQGDILGAAALGVRNILCLPGDDVSRGDHPEAKRVFDLDSVSLLRITREMRDRGTFASGRKLDSAPDLFIGATANPFVPPYADRITNLEKKVDAGAQFIQTQFCFDLPMFESFMRTVRERELHRRCAIIVGVGTLSSAKALRWMAANVPGVHIPDAIISRIASAPDQKAEARTILIETMQALAGIDGVAGVHLMGHRNEQTLVEAITLSGLRPAMAPSAHPLQAQFPLLQAAP